MLLYIEPGNILVCNHQPANYVISAFYPSGVAKLSTNINWLGARLVPNQLMLVLYLSTPEG